MAKKTEKPKTCFVIAPTGEPFSLERRNLEGLLSAIIRPVLEEAGFEIRVAHQVSAPNTISTQAIRELLEADLVLADLTSLNPNVMYELAVRHTAHKPVVTIAETGTSLPFDVASQRTIFFVRDLMGAENLKKALEAEVRRYTGDSDPYNPVYVGHRPGTNSAPVLRPSSSVQGIKIFLCHAREDKEAVRDLYQRLVSDGCEPWLDEVNLLPGQEWEMEIQAAVRSSDVVVVVLSSKAVSKDGFIHKEIRFALDAADEKSEGTIFIIPALLGDSPVPTRLSRWQWVRLDEEDGYERLLRSLERRASEPLA